MRTVELGSIPKELLTRSFRRSSRAPISAYLEQLTESRIMAYSIESYEVVELDIEVITITELE